MKKFCVFDLDGTLIDSMPEWGANMVRILDEEKVEYPKDIVQIITPLGYKDSAKLYKQLGVSGTEEEIVERMSAYAYEAYANRIPLKPYVKEFLTKLAAQGHVLAVLTASPHVTTDVCLKRNGVFDMFRYVWSVNDFGTVKSDPEIYRMAAQRLGADISEITFFDDNLTALSTAVKAGLECVGVYDITSADKTDEIKKLSHKYINSFKELM